MLYYLLNTTTGDTFYLIQQEEFTIGRRNCDILIQDDLSISKQHAVIRIRNGSFFIADLGSKYKTVLNESLLKPNVEVPLKINAEIKFGAFESIYRFKQQEIITTATSFGGSEKIKLKNVLNIIGASYVDNWSPKCTHLTVKEMSVTVKVLQALLDEKPIVVAEYWTQFSQNVLKNEPPPDINKFNNPPFGEPMLRNFNFNDKINRKFLFRGKELIFPKDQNKILLEEVIRKAGGTCRSWEANPEPLTDLFNSPKKIIVIQVLNQNESSSFKKLIEAVSKKGQRVIPLQEIALAIITGTCAKNCNPDFDRAGSVFGEPETSKPIKVLVESTQSEYFKVGRAAENETLRVIPDTYEPPLEPLPVEQVVKTNSSSSADTPPLEQLATRTSKRKNEEQLDMSMEKKLKIEMERMVFPSTSKDIQPEKSSAKSEKNSSNSSDSSDHGASSKRRLEEEESQLSPLKKVNPFAIYMKQKKDSTDSSLENSNKRFKTETDSADSKSSQVNVTKTSAISQKNTFARPSTSNMSTNMSVSTEQSFANRSNIFSSTRQNIESSPPKSTRQLSRQYLSSIPWISRSTIPTKTEGEISDPKTEGEISDPELKVFCEVFRGQAVIEFVEPTTFMRQRLKSLEDVFDGNTTGKNFKKFKKVKPKKPQTVIITSDDSILANSSRRLQHGSTVFTGSNVEHSPTDKSDVKNKFISFFNS